MKKKLFALAGMFILGAGVCVAANNINEKIEATKAYDVNIKYNGEIKTMYDANGNQVYPIMYEGTTYVPVRAVSQIFDVAVNWDGATRTVLLGENSEWTKLTKEDVGTTKWIDGDLDFTYDGIKYDSGLKYESDNGIISPLTAFSFKLDNKYTKLAFKVCTETVNAKYENMKLVIRDSDTEEIIFEKDLNSNSMEDIIVDVAGHNEVRVGTSVEKYNVWYDNMTIHIVDVKAK